MKVVKDSLGDAVIYPFDNARHPAIKVRGDDVDIRFSTQGNWTLEEAITLCKALQEAVSIAQVNRHQAQLSADAKAVQE